MNRSYLASPNFFMKATICEKDGMEVDSSILGGTTVASANRLKHTDNRGTYLDPPCPYSLFFANVRVSDGAFFCFPDLSVKVAGLCQLKFSLYEMRR